MSLKEDFERYNAKTNSKEVTTPISMSLELQEDSRVYIVFDTIVGKYSEVINDYKDLYETLGHLFAEENGIINAVLKEST